MSLLQLVEGNDINFYVQNSNGYEVYHLNNEKRGVYSIVKSLLPVYTDFKGMVKLSYFAKKCLN